MATFETVRVLVWHPEWSAEPIEVADPGDWQGPALLTNNPEDDITFCRSVTDATGLSCTVVRERSTTYP